MQTLTPLNRLFDRIKHSGRKMTPQLPLIDQQMLE